MLLYYLLVSIVGIEKYSVILILVTMYVISYPSLICRFSLFIWCLNSFTRKNLGVDFFFFLSLLSLEFLRIVPFEGS